MFYASNFCDQESIGGGKIRITGPYIDKAGTHSVIVTAEEIAAYRNGALIQRAFPKLSVSDREFLMTGLSDSGFKKACEENAK